MPGRSAFDICTRLSSDTPRRNHWSGFGRSNFATDIATSNSQICHWFITGKVGTQRAVSKGRQVQSFDLPQSTAFRVYTSPEICRVPFEQVSTLKTPLKGGICNFLTSFQMWFPKYNFHPQLQFLFSNRHSYNIPRNYFRLLPHLWHHLRRHILKRESSFQIGPD